MTENFRFNQTLRSYQLEIDGSTNSVFQDIHFLLLSKKLVLVCEIRESQYKNEKEFLASSVFFTQ